MPFVSHSKLPVVVQLVKIAMVGKYTDLSDAYLSVIKALQHACLAANRKLQIDWVEASHLEPQTKTEDTAAYDGECMWVVKTLLLMVVGGVWVGGL